MTNQNLPATIAFCFGEGKKVGLRGASSRRGYNYEKRDGPELSMVKGSRFVERRTGRRDDSAIPAGGCSVHTRTSPTKEAPLCTQA